MGKSAWTNPRCVPLFAIASRVARTPCSLAALRAWVKWTEGERDFGVCYATSQDGIQMNHEKKRITLIELLVVIVIIGTFTACVTPFSVDDPILTENSDELSDGEWPAVVQTFRQSVRTTDTYVYSMAALELRHWMMDHDPHYPTYHFAGPESWINDANGVIYHKGQYHLFYQYDPILPDGTRSERCWGHAVSKDLVHWTDWPVALWPDSSYDRKGVYSGNVIIDDEEIPTAFYTGNIAGGDEAYGMRARSLDGFLTWQKKMIMHQRSTPQRGFARPLGCPDLEIRQ